MLQFSILINLQKICRIYTRKELEYLKI